MSISRSCEQAETKLGCVLSFLENANNGNGNDNNNSGVTIIIVKFNYNLTVYKIAVWKPNEDLL